MSKWIDADALTSKLWFVEIKGECIDDIAEQIIRQCKQIVKDAPSIDIVRCAECRHWEMRNSPRGWCVVHQGYVSPQYFCADGERREQ